MSSCKRKVLIDKINHVRKDLSDFEYEFSCYRLGAKPFCAPRDLEDAVEFFDRSAEELLMLEKRITHLALSAA